MFLPNKYTKWYYSIISSAQSRQLDKKIYSEKHHIIPRSLGGNNAKENLVILTAREHFLCHLLLTKMVETNLQRKMIFAFTIMARTSGNQDRYKLNSRLFDLFKKKRLHSKESKLKMSKSHTGLTQSTETVNKRIEKIRGRVSPIKGTSTQTSQSKKKIGEAQRKLISSMTNEERSNRMKNSCSSPASWTQERRDKIGAAVRAAAQRRKELANDA